MKSPGGTATFPEDEVEYSHISPIGVSSTESLGKELSSARLVSSGHHVDTLPWQQKVWVEAVKGGIIPQADGTVVNAHDVGHGQAQLTDTRQVES